MPVNLPLPDPTKLFPVAGVELGFAEVGVRKADRKDLLLIRLSDKATVAGVFTRNRFCAAPVLLSKDHLAAGQGIRALVINTGNANAGTGEKGLLDARAVCEAVAAKLGRYDDYTMGVVQCRLHGEDIHACRTGGRQSALH